MVLVGTKNWKLCASLRGIDGPIRQNNFQSIMYSWFEFSLPKRHAVRTNLILKLI